MMNDEPIQPVSCRKQSLLPEATTVAGASPLPSTPDTRPSTLVYDGSFEGLLCGLNLAFSQNIQLENLAEKGTYQPSLFAEETTVETRQTDASTAWGNIQRLLVKESQRNVATAFASSCEDKGMIIYHYLAYGLQVGKDLDKCHSVHAVREMHELCQRVRHEAHRLKGLLRFKETETGIFYGPFESDHLVICQLAEFFKKRLGDQYWVLHDIGRNLMIYWDGEKLRDAEPNVDDDGPVLSESEIRHQELWRTFFRSVAIEERRNPKLQRQFMPQRYWKYLVENV